MRTSRLSSVAAVAAALFCTPSHQAQVQDSHAQPKVILCDEKSGCYQQYFEGRKYKLLTVDNISAFVSMGAYDKYIWADVTVFNGSPAPVDVLPTNFGLEEISPKEKPLAYVDADQALRSKLRRLAWGNAFTAMGGSMARQQTTTTTNSNGTISATASDGSSATGTYRGSSTATTSTPDYAAQARANEIIQQRNNTAAMLSEKVSQDALRANTVMPNGNVHGFVLFARDKKAQGMKLSIRVGDTVYQFPFAFIKR
ncbi:MAG TPA: hypothetical protein VGN16_10990 [Acidobacteriaceae bacterium]